MILRQTWIMGNNSWTYESGSFGIGKTRLKPRYVNRWKYWTYQHTKNPIS
jgi:hypothetical protein